MGFKTGEGKGGGSPRYGDAHSWWNPLISYWKHSCTHMHTHAHKHIHAHTKAHTHKCFIMSRNYHPISVALKIQSYSSNHCISLPWLDQEDEAQTQRFDHGVYIFHIWTQLFILKQGSWRQHKLTVRHTSAVMASWNHRKCRMGRRWEERWDTVYQSCLLHICRCVALWVWSSRT